MVVAQARGERSAVRQKEVDVYVMSMGDGLLLERMQVCKLLWDHGINAEFLYKTTDYYAPAHERCIRWDDTQLAIDWPLDGLSPHLSAKDQQGLSLTDAETFA